MRLIDADSLKRSIGELAFNNLDYLPDWAYDRIIKIVDCEKTADAELVIHGHWIDEIVENIYSSTGYAHSITCSKCYNSFIVSENAFPYERFCRNCGAKMDEEMPK